LPRDSGRGAMAKYFTEVCSGSEAGSYLRPLDFVQHSSLGLRVITKRRRRGAMDLRRPAILARFRVHGSWFRV